MAFGIFKKKSKKTADDRYFNLEVKEVVPIAKDAVNLVFNNENQFNYEPGQFLTIIQEIEGKKVRRAYSLCTTPFEDEHPAVTVKRVPGGIMSNHLNDHAVVGQELEVMEPMGLFTTDYNSGNTRHAVFFGGGSGITPLISIIRSLLIKEPEVKIALVYGNRSEEYVIFKDLIAELEKSNPNRFEAIHILEEGQAHYQGRPTVELITEITEKLGCNQKTEFYICGPQPMMDVVTSSLKGTFPADNIRLESFESSPSKEEPKGGKSATSSAVTVILDGEEHHLEVSSDTPILDAALDASLDMPYSCQSGLCTACRGKCLEGNVSIDDAEGLSQEELDDGYVLTCVGKPTSEKVIVEIG